MNSLKKLLGTSLAFSMVAAGIFAGSALADGSISWKKELSKGLEQAKAENKYVLADVYTDWCGWCKRLDATTFADPKFAEFLNKQFVAVKVNAEDKGEGTKAAAENNVTGFPTALVYNSEGKVIGKVVGYRPAKSYQEALEDVVKKAH